MCFSVVELQNILCKSTRQSQVRLWWDLARICFAPSNWLHVGGRVPVCLFISLPDRTYKWMEGIMLFLIVEIVHDSSLPKQTYEKIQFPHLLHYLFLFICKIWLHHSECSIQPSLPEIRLIISVMKQKERCKACVLVG